MNTDTKVVRLRQPDEIDDRLTDMLRAGARRLLAQAIELEADAFLADMRDLKLPDGRARLVRLGHGPEREIQTGIGPVPVARVRIRDRGAIAVDRVRLSSSILPKWARRTRSLDALLSVLYLRGVSTGDFQDALAALLGCDAPNLSPSVIARLTAEWQAEWQAEYVRWQGRDLSARRYVSVWADGVYLQARMAEHAECMLVLIGATPQGGKELVGCQSALKRDPGSAANGDPHRQLSSGRPRSPLRGPARVAQCPHERRSDARGEALWTPGGDPRSRTSIRSGF